MIRVSQRQTMALLALQLHCRSHIVYHATGHRLGDLPNRPATTAANRIDVAIRRRVRTTAACRLCPLGDALPSTTSARCRHPLFGRFLGSMATPSDDLARAPQDWIGTDSVWRS